MATDKYKIKVEGAPQQVDSLVMNFPQPPLNKSEDYLKAYEGYVYTATSAIAQEVASIDLHLFKIRYVKNEPVTDEVFIHPALSVLQHVNDFMTFYELTEATQVYLELVGEAFWVILREGRTGEPREIWPIRPDWVKVVPDANKVVGGYVYNPGGNPQDKLIIPAENMIHFKYFHPMNPYRGRGSVQAAAMPLDIHKFAQDWNRNFFYNSAIPGLVFTSEKKFNRQAVQRFIEQWQNSYGGRANSHKVAFLGGGFKLEKATMGAKDLDFTEQQKIMRDDILAVFRVPKTILGLTEDVNKANAEATTRAFMERVVTPRMKKYIGTLTERYLQMFSGTESMMLDFTDPSPEDVETKLKVYENGRQYGWMTSNEIRIQENLEPVEGGDTLAPIAADQAALPDGEGMEDDADTEEETQDDKDKGLIKVFTKFFPKKKTVRKVFKYRYRKAFKHMMPIPTKRLETIKREELQKGLTQDLTKLISELMKEVKPDTSIKPARYKGQHEDLWTDDAKNAYWLDFVEKATRKEVALRNRIIPLFDEQEREVLEALDQHKHLSKAKRKSLLTDALIDVATWSARWLAVILPFVREMILEEGNAKLVMLDQNQPFNMDTEEVSTFLRSRLADFVTEINDTTRADLKRALQEGIDAGESIAQLRKRVQGVMSYAKTDRATMIARTESIRSTNFGAHEAYRQSTVVVAKEWLTQRDGRACPFCTEMDGKKVKIVDNYFQKGDVLTVEGKTMKFEVDDVTFPPLHPNCRCTLIPVLEDSSKAYDQDKADDLVKLAELKANETVEKAVEKAHAIVEKAKEEAEQLKSDEKEKALEVAKTKATEIVKVARKEATDLVVEAQKEVEEEKKGILGWLKGIFSN